MKSIFRYPGGKTRSSIQDWIKDHRPPGCKEYREPFVGGGGVFFCMDGFERYWLNDMHSGLTAVYQALSERPEEFIAKCKGIDPPRDDDELTDPGPRGGKRVNKRLNAIFESVAFDDAYEDQAFRYFFVNRTVFGGRVNYDIPSRLYFSNPEGWNIVTNGQLEDAARKLQGVKITCGDYSELFDAPGDDVWIYADPPYLVNTDLSRSSQLYQHSFTLDDHRNFAEVVRRCKHKVCISYDDDPGGEIRRIFEGFHIKDGRWKYCGTTDKGKETGHELLIFHNYIPPMIDSMAIAAREDEEGDLTEAETELLERLEQEIEEDLAAFVRVGHRLQIIRDERLWGPDGNFLRYMQRRWVPVITEGRANMLIQSSKLLRHELSAKIFADKPSIEWQVRQLVRLKDDKGEPDPVQAAKVWNKLVVDFKDKRRITAKLVRAAVDAELGIDPPEAPDFVETFRRRWAKLTKKEQASIREIVK